MFSAEENILNQKVHKFGLSYHDFSHGADIKVPLHTQIKELIVLSGILFVLFRSLKSIFLQLL